MKLRWLLLVLLGLLLTNCSKDDDSGKDIELATGIPDNSKATPSPEVNPAESNVSIPNVGFATEKLNGYKVVNMNMTGIFNKLTGEWMKLHGTATGEQNIWLEIDGVPRSIKAESTGETRAAKKALADVVFLIDNSGSMSEEADQLAKEVDAWSLKLSGLLDLQLGCVGYDGDINGGIDLGTYEDLSAYLNREGYQGTYRTIEFDGTRATELETAAPNYSTGWNECGAAALHFADEHYTFRPGANRIYVNFTDEPNQPNGNAKFSVSSVVSQDDWKVWQGTIHSVFSGSRTYGESYPWRDLYEEKPWLMSDYTGGTSILDAPSSFEGVTLESLPVTGALTNSYNVKFHYTPDLSTGKHKVKITILSPDKSVKAVREFIDVSFAE